MLQSSVVGDEHYNTARQVSQRYSAKELQDIIAILGLDELSEDDRVTVAEHGSLSASCLNRSL